MGNLVEAYDISICYFLAAELSRSLLGNAKGNPSVILSLVFIAYLAKPIGAFILGLFSDLLGRKNVLIISILIMGLATTCIGLIPGYDAIGIYAAGLLLIFRIIQSMALGSEFLNSASYLVESGNNQQRGFRGCWPSVGVKAGYLVAALIVQMMNYLGEHYLISANWLWRIPFVLALITTVFGVYIRYNMPESMDYIVYYAQHTKPTTKVIYRQSLRFVRQFPFLFNYAFFASFLSVATGFFFYLYIPLHAIQHSELSQQFIMQSTIASLTFVCIIIPVFGWISDKLDRLKMLTWATAGLLILAYPFMLAINYGNSTEFLLMQLLLSIPCACYYSVSSVILTELVPLPIRCTALSIVFSIAASIASGLPPLLANYLYQHTNSPNSPSIIMIVMALTVLVNIKFLAQKYRRGRNQYETIQMDAEGEAFKINYRDDTRRCERLSLFESNI